MPQLPEKELLELLEMAQAAANVKAKEASELETAIAQKWKQRLQGRQSKQPK